MTREERIIEAGIVLAKIRALGFKPEIKGEWIIYSQKIPNKLLMRAMAVPNEIFNLIKETPHGNPSESK